MWFVLSGFSPQHMVLAHVSLRTLWPKLNVAVALQPACLLTFKHTNTYVTKVGRQPVMPALLCHPAQVKHPSYALAKMSSQIWATTGDGWLVAVTCLAGLLVWCQEMDHKECASCQVLLHE